MMMRFPLMLEVHVHSNALFNAYSGVLCVSRRINAQSNDLIVSRCSYTPDCTLLLIKATSTKLILKKKPLLIIITRF